MSEEQRRAGPGGLLDLPLVVLEEAIHAVPLLLDRTRRQVELVRRLAGHLPCVGGLLEPAEPLPVPAHEVAPVDVLSVIAEEGTASTATDWSSPDGAATVPSESEEASENSPSSADLPVPDYDALAASQVVPRLATLSTEELEAVRAYERAHRNRQTILTKVAQLLEA